MPDSKILAIEFAYVDAPGMVAEEIHYNARMCVVHEGDVKMDLAVEDR